MKTAMQELMANIKVKRSKDFGKLYVIEICEPEKIKELLEKEKQQIVDAYDDGKYLTSGENYNGNTYYKKTFEVNQ
jgi:hypothetical protein